MMRLQERESRGSLTPGQDLILAGYAGLAGANRIARAREKELRTWFSAEYVRQMQQGIRFVLDPDSGFWRDLGVTEWQKAGEGGIHTALWRLSGGYQTGFQIWLHRVPVRQDTIELCERYDLNPYDLYSDCMLLAADHGGSVEAALCQERIPAACIGIVQAGMKKEICFGRVHRFMDRPGQDELYKILKEEAKT